MNGGDDASKAIGDLQAMMIQLRDGWGGFTVDEYYPFQYEPRDLLAEFYWGIASAVVEPGVQNRDALERALREARPPPSAGPLRDAFRRALTKHGLADAPE